MKQAVGWWCVVLIGSIQCFFLSFDSQVVFIHWLSFNFRKNTKIWILNWFSRLDELKNKLWLSTVLPSCVSMLSFLSPWCYQIHWKCFFHAANWIAVILKQHYLNYSFVTKAPFPLYVGEGQPLNSLCSERQHIDVVCVRVCLCVMPAVGTNEVPRWQQHQPVSAQRWRDLTGHPGSDSWSSFREQSNSAGYRSLW